MSYASPVKPLGPVCNPTVSRTIAFIDPGIEDYQHLAKGVLPGVQVCILHPEEDGVNQILQVLGERTDISAVHVFSHGSPGELHLGTAQLDFDTIDCYLTHPHWTALAGVDLFLYGCSVAEGICGNAFLFKMHYLADVNLAASAKPVGSPARGADWNLEVRVGEVDPQSVLLPVVMATYDGVLGPLTVPNWPSEFTAIFTCVDHKPS